MDKIDENIVDQHSSANTHETDTNKEDVGSPFEMINTVYVWQQATRTTHYNIKLCSIKIFTSCIKVMCKMQNVGDEKVSDSESHEVLDTPVAVCIFGWTQWCL